MKEVNKMKSISVSEVSEILKSACGGKMNDREKCRQAFLATKLEDNAMNWHIWKRAWAIAKADCFKQEQNTADDVDLNKMEADGLNDLLPCPFCGEIPVVNKRASGNWEVRCANENCGVIVMTDEKISRRLAIKTWNLRAK